MKEIIGFDCWSRWLMPRRDPAIGWAPATQSGNTALQHTEWQPRAASHCFNTALQHTKWQHRAAHTKWQHRAATHKVAAPRCNTSGNTTQHSSSAHFTQCNCTYAVYFHLSIYTMEWEILTVTLYIFSNGKIFWSLCILLITATIFFLLQLSLFCVFKITLSVLFGEIVPIY